MQCEIDKLERAGAAMLLRHHPERPVHPDDLPVDVLVRHHGLDHLGVLVGVAEAGGVRHSLGQEPAHLHHIMPMKEITSRPTTKMYMMIKA